MNNLNKDIIHLHSSPLIPIHPHSDESKKVNSHSSPLNVIFHITVISCQLLEQCDISLSTRFNRSFFLNVGKLHFQAVIMFRRVCPLILSKTNRFQNEEVLSVCRQRIGCPDDSAFCSNVGYVLTKKICFKEFTLDPMFTKYEADLLPQNMPYNATKGRGVRVSPPL